MAVARAFALVGLTVVVMAGCSGKIVVKRSAATSPALPWPYTAARVEYGWIRSLTPLDRGYELRFDLGLLFGPDKTGIAACVDNHECPPGTTGFLDDSYVHDLKYVVTYYVPPTAAVELVSGSGQFPYPTVTARYLYGLAHGRNPRHVHLQAPGRLALHEFGFDIDVGDSEGPHHGYEAVTRLFQVFHP